MKTILVPLDHTSAAEHTLAYANKLAVRWPAHIVLLYCVPTGAPDLAGQEQQLRSLVERLRYQQLTRQDGRRIQYTYRVLGGCLHDQVQAEAARFAPDLIVMGLEHIDCGRPVPPGNHAAAITELVSCPVLVVPPGRRPLPSRLVFSADFFALPLPLLPRLSALESAFPGAVDLVQFYPPVHRAHRRRLKQALSQAAAQLTWPHVATHLLEDDAPLEGISEFCARTQAQLLVVAPTSSAQLLQFFDQCYATTQAYHTQIPVLVLRAAERPTGVACCERCAGRLAQQQVSSLHFA